MSNQLENLISKKEEIQKKIERENSILKKSKYLESTKKRKERTGPHGAGCLYLGGSGHSDMVTVPGRRQKSRSDRFCPHHGGWFKQPV